MRITFLSDRMLHLQMIKNIPAHTVWYGNPAKQHGFVTKSGIILDNEKRDSDGVFRNLEE